LRQRSTIIGNVVGLEIEKQLQAGYTPGNFPAMVVVNFKPDEIAHFVPRLADLILDETQGPVKVVVAAKTRWEGIPEQYFLPEGETSTRFRNNNVSGLVLVEYDLQSDRQGLRNMKTFNDRTLLAGIGKTGEGLRLLLEEAWRVHCVDMERLPGMLCEAVFKIYEELGRRRSVSLRDWVDFLEECCVSLSEKGRAWDGSEVRSAVGNALFRLGLFPDPVLFAQDRQIERRIEHNSNFSRLRNVKGREVDEDDLLQLIELVSFKDKDGDLLESREIKRLREAARLIVQPVGEVNYNSLTFDLWGQIFEGDRDENKLGDQVYEIIAKQCPDRIEEFEGLDLHEGLNDEDMEAANEFVRSMPMGDDDPLFDLVGRGLQRRIEKIAAPRVSIESDPLRALLYAVHEFIDTTQQNGEGERSIVSLTINNLRDDDGWLSLNLFRWIYGVTLRDIADESERSSVGCKLTLDPRLKDSPKRLETVLPNKGGEDEEEFDQRKHWKELRFALRLGKKGRVVHQFVWRPLDDPGLAMFARMIQSQDPFAYVTGSEVRDLETWVEAGLDITGAIQGGEPPGGEAGDPCNRWFDMRNEVFQEWTKNGLSYTGIDDYLEQWVELLDRLRNEHVPDNAPDASLTAFLQMETLTGRDGKYALLASHPLRLRWIGRHFEKIKQEINRALEGALEINSINDSFYFDRLGKVSPHGQPPIYCPKDGVLAIATREYGWHEEFSLIRDKDASVQDWISTVDDASIAEIAATVRAYLEYHPHKMDGLSLLLLSHDGDSRAIRRLVSTIRQRDYASVALDLHIIAPTSMHSDIGLTLGDLETAEDRETVLLPSLRIHLHPWHDEGDAALLHDFDDYSVDIAIVPNFFGVDTQAQVNTLGAGDSREGRFDPWIDKTSFKAGKESAQITTNVTKTLLPSTRDPLLETWSTLSVWHYRNSPVSPRHDNTDYFTLQVRFDTSSQLFAQLHQVAHWVVTLDAFIGRDQIESLENHPDVITIKPDVGKNDMYTLIVSSGIGAEFVKRRLVRKIRDDLKLNLDDTEALVDRLYILARNATPGLVLRSLGLGSTTQEMLGMVAARYSVLEHFPVDNKVVFDAWISLDEHTDWFGGAQQSRADAMRLVGRRENESAPLQLSVQIVESKFREREETAEADQQLSRSVELIQDALMPQTANQDDLRADAPFWRMEILSALNQCSRRSIPKEDFPPLAVYNVDEAAQALLSPVIQEQIRSGEYILESVEGIVCTVAHGLESVPERKSQTSRGHHWLRMARPGLAHVFEQAMRQEIEDPDDPVGIVTPPGGNDKKPKITTKPVNGRGLGHDGLLAKYQVVLDAFDEFDVQVHSIEDEPFQEGPGFYIVRIQPGRGVPPDRIMDRVSELKLKLRLPANHSPLPYIDQGAIVFEIPKTDEERYPVYAEDLWERTDRREDILYAPIGEDIRGDVVGINFSSSESPHMLIAGTTGSGKSVALESILRGLCHFYTPDQLQLHLIDPKTTELVSFEDDPHVVGEIGGFAEDAIEILEEAVEEMQRRYKLLKEHKAKDISAYKTAEVEDDREDLPWRVVVLDEYADLTSDNDDRKTIEKSLRRLAQKARACGIHVIVATQKPSANIISTTIRSNLPVQLALRVNSATDSRIIMDEGGAEALAGKGDAFLKRAKGKERIQCAMLRSS
jgi:DNA segregation ATPase FtsK/SpoIIIE, S-DNA-T family